jgi:diacylglycerol kinase (ATP)
VQKIRVFLNQQASQGAERDWKKLIRERLFRSDLEFVSPTSHQAFLEEIDRATRDQIDVIVSVGGDGTIHELIQKLADQKITFLVLPAGTANDFARSLGVQKMRISDLLSIVREGVPKEIDLIELNGKLMATNGGIGVVAQIANRVNHLRRTVPGFKKLMTYGKQETYGILLASKILFEGCDYFDLNVKCDQFNGTIRTPLLMINNQPLIAANYPVAPLTKHDDGTFNVTIFLHQKTADFVASVYRIRQGISPENDPMILSFETTAITFESVDGKTLSFMGDGELLSSSSRFEVGIRPKALRVFTEMVKQIHLSNFSGTGEKK